MKTYTTQEQVEKEIKNGIWSVDESVEITFDLRIEASIKITGNIKAGDINAGNIDAWNINARNINAGNINARNINAGNIIGFAFCIAYESFKCLSIKMRRKNHIVKCLDKDIVIKDKK